MPDLIPLPVLARKLVEAATRTELVTAAQSIQHLPEHWQREQANRIVKRRLVDFKKR
jgi:hypothetical protein